MEILDTAAIARAGFIDLSERFDGVRPGVSRPVNKNADRARTISKDPGRVTSADSSSRRLPMSFLTDLLTKIKIREFLDSPDCLEGERESGNVSKRREPEFETGYLTIYE